MSRLRDLGIVPGYLPTGPRNAITDVSGVCVGHVSLVSGEGKLTPGVGPIRTGVTAILPHRGNLYRQKVTAAVKTINGFGKATGFEQVRERGVIETPIILTNTLNVGRAADAVVAYMLRDNPDIGITAGTVSPIVGECNDGFVNDLQGRHVQQQHVWQAIKTAHDGAVAEGNVGAGTGTQCFQFKAGIGTASRQVRGFTLGALVQSNFGLRRDLMVLGAPIGQHFLEKLLPQPGPGSIMMVLATDAPFESRQLERLAMRAAFGLGRTGSFCQDGSGDFVIAFSTANPWPHYVLEEAPASDAQPSTRMVESGPVMDDFFLAVVETIEEAILNSMIAAETMTGRDGNTLHAIPHDQLVELLRHYGRL